MNSNYGGKIKTFAVIIMILGILSSLVGGIVMMVSIGKNAPGVGFFSGVAVIAGGVFASVFAYYMIAGFGQLIENSDTVAEHFSSVNEKARRKAEKVRRTENEKKIEKKIEEKVSDPKVPNGEWIDFACPNCGEDISFKKEAFMGDEPVNCPLCDTEIDVNKVMRK